MHSAVVGQASTMAAKDDSMDTSVIKQSISGTAESRSARMKEAIKSGSLVELMQYVAAVYIQQQSTQITLLGTEQCSLNQRQGSRDCGTCLFSGS